MKKFMTLFSFFLAGLVAQSAQAEECIATVEVQAYSMRVLKKSWSDQSDFSWTVEEACFYSNFSDHREDFASAEASEAAHALADLVQLAIDEDQLLQKKWLVGRKLDIKVSFDFLGNGSESNVHYISFPLSSPATFQDAFGPISDATDAREILFERTPQPKFQVRSGEVKARSVSILKDKNQDGRYLINVVAGNKVNKATSLQVYPVVRDSRGRNHVLKKQRVVVQIGPNKVLNRSFVVNVPKAIGGPRKISFRTRIFDSAKDEWRLHVADYPIRGFFFDEETETLGGFAPEKELLRITPRLK